MCESDCKHVLEGEDSALRRSKVFKRRRKWICERRRIVLDQEEVYAYEYTCKL